MSFKSVFEKLYQRWDKCVVAEGEYFNGKQIYKFYLCSIIVFKQIPGTFDSLRIIDITMFSQETEQETFYGCGCYGTIMGTHL